MAPVVKNEQAAVKVSRRHGYVVDVVHRFVRAGVGVEVLAKLHAYSLRVVDDAATREVGGSAKGHVLQEVSQTALRFLLLHRTHLLHDVEESLLLRKIVVTDVIGHAIGQDTHANCRINRQLRDLLCKNLHCGQESQRQQE